MAIELPDLPYDRTALEPHLSGETLDQHHGHHQRALIERINTLVTNVIEQSDVTSADGHIRMSEEIRGAADVLRDFLYEAVYDPINQLPRTLKMQDIVRTHFNYYLQRPHEMPELYAVARNDDPVERRVADYVASMTDRFAMDLYESLHEPLEVR